jgi:hypothetical protein
MEDVMIWIDGEYFEDQCQTARVERARRYADVYIKQAESFVKMYRESSPAAWGILGDIISGQTQIALSCISLWPFPAWKYGGGMIKPVSYADGP